MSEEKRRVGRPSMPENLKAKPITKPTRVPVEIAALVKQLADAYRAGTVSLDDIRALANKEA